MNVKMEQAYLSNDQTIKALVDDYANLFSTSQGMRVLAHMLYSLGLFAADLNSAQDVALRNYAVELVKIVTRFRSNATAESFMMALMSQNNRNKGVL